MRRLTIPALLAIFAALLFTLPVTAGWEWCDADPVVQVNANRVQVIVSIPSVYLSQVDQPTRITITTPQGVTDTLVSKGPGLNGREEVFTFKRASDSDDESSSLPVRIDASVGLKGNPSGVPLRLTVIANNGAPVVSYGDTKGTTILITLPR